MNPVTSTPDGSLTQLSPLPLSSHAKPVDSFAQAAELERDLRRTVQGEVRFDRGSRALYASDASNYRQAPIGLVVPRDDEDVIATIAPLPRSIIDGSTLRTMLRPPPRCTRSIRCNCARVMSDIGTIS